MAIVFLAHNGIGVGHLARSLALCDALASLGEPPVIFSQSVSWNLGDHCYHGKVVPSLRKAGKAEKTAVIRDIERYAGLSDPAIVFEDTHPCGLDLGKSLRRILVVRPTEFDYLAWLARDQRGVYDAFLIADAPGSPTWIYDNTQTTTILGWPNWFVLGPVYRAVTEQQRQIVMKRHRIDIGDPICVLSMGGGGVRSSSDDDVTRFIDVATTTGTALQRVDPRTRLLFVRGPLFPADVALPREFELIANEPFVPALMSVARGAIIRPGFNTSWECLSNGTPFMPVLGTSYREPISERISRLENLGFVTFDLPYHWNNQAWIAERTRRALTVRTVWPGSADPTVLSRQIRRTATCTVSERLDSRKVFNQASTHSTISQIGIRVDDVVSLDSRLRWLIDQLLERGLRASLEVIPYLCRISEADLDALDPHRLLTISQHGYTHIPRVSKSCDRCEFGMDSLPSIAEAEQITTGRKLLIARFPSRFSGGFSPPYDALPPWLGPLWAELGGNFISCISARPRLAQVRIVRPLIETWNWTTHNAIPTEQVFATVQSEMIRTGRSAIVIHPWLLTTLGERQRIEDLLNQVFPDGATNASLSELRSHGDATRECR